MFDFDHDADTALDTSTPGDLLAEIGLDPRAIREVLASRDGEGE